MMDEAEFGVDDISENEYNKLKEKIMPTVDGKKFAYTKEGKEKAKKYAKKKEKKVKYTYAKKGRYL